MQDSRKCVLGCKLRLDAAAQSAVPTERLPGPSGGSVDPLTFPLVPFTYLAERLLDEPAVIQTAALGMLAAPAVGVCRAAD